MSLLLIHVTVAGGKLLRRCSSSSVACHVPRRWKTEFLIGTPRAGVVAAAVIMGSEVDCLAAERAALVDERLIFLDAHGDGQEAERSLGCVSGSWSWC